MFSEQSDPRTGWYSQIENGVLHSVEALKNETYKFEMDMEPMNDNKLRLLWIIILCDRILLTAATFWLNPSARVNSAMRLHPVYVYRCAIIFQLL